MTVQYPPRKRYLYFKSGERVVRVNKDDPADKMEVEREGAVKYTIDPRNRVIYYLTESGEMVKEEFGGKQATKQVE